jgi:hypothetical protein
VSFRVQCVFTALSQRESTLLPRASYLHRKHTFRSSNYTQILLCTTRYIPWPRCPSNCPFSKRFSGLSNLCECSNCPPGSLCNLFSPSCFDIFQACNIGKYARPTQSAFQTFQLHKVYTEMYQTDGWSQVRR